MSTEQSNRHAYWQQHILRFQQSGLSGTQYCAREALTYHCFAYWRRKLTAEHGGSASVQKSGIASAHTPSGFVTVQTDAHPSSLTETGLELSLPNGLIIGNIRANNLSLVGQLLEQL